MLQSHEDALKAFFMGLRKGVVMRWALIFILWFSCVAICLGANTLKDEYIKASKEYLNTIKHSAEELLSYIEKANKNNRTVYYTSVTKLRNEVKYHFSSDEGIAFDLYTNPKIKGLSVSFDLECMKLIWLLKNDKLEHLEGSKETLEKLVIDVTEVLNTVEVDTIETPGPTWQVKAAPKIQEAEKRISPTATAATWHEVARWEGKGYKNTETFHVNSKQWKVSWNFYSEDEGHGVFYVYAMREDGTATDKAVSYSGGSGSDSTILRSGPGDCYLKIMSANGSWQIIVEDKR